MKKTVLTIFAIALSVSAAPVLAKEPPTAIVSEGSVARQALHDKTQAERAGVKIDRAKIKASHAARKQRREAYRAAQPMPAISPPSIGAPAAK